MLADGEISGSLSPTREESVQTVQYHTLSDIKPERCWEGLWECADKKLPPIFYKLEGIGTLKRLLFMRKRNTLLVEQTPLGMSFSVHLGPLRKKIHVLFGENQVVELDNTVLPSVVVSGNEKVLCRVRTFWEEDMLVREITGVEQAQHYSEDNPVYQINADKVYILTRIWKNENGQLEIRWFGLMGKHEVQFGRTYRRAKKEALKENVT